MKTCLADSLMWHARRAGWLMLVAVVLPCGVSSCGKIRELVKSKAESMKSGSNNKDLLGKLKESKSSAAGESSVVGSAAAVRPSQIPQEISDIYPVQSARVVVVDYYADWCGPCKMLSPILDRVAGDHRDQVMVCRINVDQQGPLAKKMRVNSIPDVRIYSDGALVDQFVGLISEAQCRQKIENLLKALPAKSAVEGSATSTAPASTDRKGPAIQPMKKGWMPEGVKPR